MSFYQYIKKVFLHFICWFIPSKELRDEIRDGEFESLRRKVVKIQDSLDIISKALVDNKGFGYLELMMKNAKVPEKYYSIIQSIKKDDICIDLGANIGIITDIFRFQDAVVYSFEPNVNLYNSVLRKKYANDDKVHLYQQAVSNVDGEKKFYHECGEKSDLCDSQGGSICSKQDDNCDELEGDVDVVKTINFGNFFKNEFKDKQIYLIKMDIEGAEFEVVEQIIEEKLYKNIKYILVETHERFFSDGKEKLNKIKKLITENNINNIYLDWV